MLSCCVSIVQGEHLSRGSRLEDFYITLGDAKCVPVPELADNEVACKPPTHRPTNINDTFCDGDTLSLRVSGRHFNGTTLCLNAILFCFLA